MLTKPPDFAWWHPQQLAEILLLPTFVELSIFEKIITQVKLLNPYFQGLILENVITNKFFPV